MKKKKTGKSALEASFDYLALKPRTVREVEDRLDSLNYGEYEVYEAVERLKELGYLDDAKYAADFASSRLSSKPVSRRKLREQLYSHNISGESIEAALSGVDDSTELGNAIAVAEKFYRQFEGQEERERRRRVARRLEGRGYGYDIIRASLEAVCGGSEDLGEAFTEEGE